MGGQQSWTVVPLIKPHHYNNDLVKESYIDAFLRIHQVSDMF